jgi:hypothetical protein
VNTSGVKVYEEPMRLKVKHRQRENKLKNLNLPGGKKSFAINIRVPLEMHLYLKNKQQFYSFLHIAKPLLLAVPLIVCKK